jgi:DNA-binding Lrp family transcriptional regulator
MSAQRHLRYVRLPTFLPRKAQATWKGHAVVQAYILVQTEVGKAAAVASEIARISGVVSAEDVTGPYDVIVRAQADDVDLLGQLVVAQVQGVAGITRTLTCPVVHLAS